MKESNIICFSQSEADTIIFFACSALHESGYNGPVVIGVADMDAYASAAVIV